MRPNFSRIPRVTFLQPAAAPSFTLIRPRNPLSPRLHRNKSLHPLRRARMTLPISGLSPLASRAARSLACNVALYVLARAVRQRALTAAGLRHALFLGVVLGACLGVSGWGLCAMFFAVGTGATRVGRARKEKLGIAEMRGGARAPANVWGAAGVAFLCAVGAAVAEVAGLRAVAEVARVGYVCAVAAKMSDTLGSEIGKAYGRDAFLVTSLRKVRPGTEGAVSVEGTVAGVVGSVVAAGYAVWTGLVGGWGAGAVVVVAAFVATTAESFIGVLVQGRFELSNEMVNFLNTLIAAVVGVLLWMLGSGVGVSL